MLYTGALPTFGKGRPASAEPGLRSVPLALSPVPCALCPVQRTKQEINNKFANNWKVSPMKNNMNKSKYKLTPAPSLREERGGLT